MSLNLKNFIKLVEQRNPNEPEFLQAVTEVVEDLIPYIVENRTDLKSTSISLNESSNPNEWFLSVSPGWTTTIMSKSTEATGFK